MRYFEQIDLLFLRTYSALNLNIVNSSLKMCTLNKRNALHTQKRQFEECYHTESNYKKDISGRIHPFDQGLTAASVKVPLSVLSWRKNAPFFRFPNRVLSVFFAHFFTKCGYADLCDAKWRILRICVVLLQRIIINQSYDDYCLGKKEARTI